MVGRSLVFGGLLVCTSLLAGCSEELPEFGQVDGVLTVKGAPKKGMFITFMPEPTEGKELPYNATSETDEQGKYRLRYVHDGQEGEGAPIGWHRVIVHDPRFSSIPQGQSLPPRFFSVDYGNPTKTPLKFEVKPGPQTINIELK